MNCKGNEEDNSLSLFPGHSTSEDVDGEMSPQDRDRSSTWSPGRKTSRTSSKNTLPTTNFHELNLEEKIEAAFHTSASLLREILFDFSHYLSKVLVGSRGQVSDRDKILRCFRYFKSR